ncbi:MAG TPA: aldo/keto reductase [Bacillota bacterium]|nr:aldo/keto reductase [Bacillota bacterium]HOH10594.1 aldo/keto reductase [Bacillota bacterium]HOY89615.1 aldo/keto reductase [Bacillota bacterium]HPI01931.1 aldo/keto reductase [Bacillota bacterium]HPM63643.1 aldo/keto reductase [Bacillota bacterium]
MERRRLGRSGITVSRMCLGTLTVGSLQMGMDPKKAADVFEAAYEKGVDFYDSAMIYGSHPHVNEFLKRVPRDKVTITSKSYDYTYDGMRKSVETALRQLGTDYIDIYLMHEQESRLTLKGHEDGFKCLVDCKEQGLIRAVGVSTHACEVAEAASELDFLDVLHPMFNYKSIGFLDGGIERMEKAVARAHEAGLGVYAMKILGGGLMIGEIQKALRWALANDDLDSIAIGIANKRELELDLMMFEGIEPSKEQLLAAYKSKSILIEEWCSGCGACVPSCKQGAISVVNGKAEVDRNKCVLCGYCGRACPNFNIRIV